MTPKLIVDIPTPALIVDVKAMDRNIARMASFFSEGSCRLRPHFKAHKTPAIAARQLAAGSVAGLTCATVFEAEVVAPFCDDILIATEVASPDKCSRVAALAADRAVTVAVDSLTGLSLLAAAAQRVGSTVRVLVDVNVGQNRCGVPPGLPAVALAQRVVEISHLRLAGVMGYEGHVQPIADRTAREASAQHAMELLVETADLIRGNGLPCEIVSAGGTGTYDISGSVPGVTEIQAGSYVLMDSDYGRLDLPFEQALFLLATIVSRPMPERAVADCGHKACAKDHGNPLVADMPGVVVVGLNDEHATIALPVDTSLEVGSRLRMRPSHVDPTMNLHDVVYAVDGARVIDCWPIARGYGAVGGEQ